ncbi:Sparc [Halotydeus destructor]|nr:Sparc [Halotydeus destructor]
MKLSIFAVLMLALLASEAMAKKIPKKAKPTPSVSTESDVEENTIEDTKEARSDPCESLRCGHGKECVINMETSEATCECIRECGDTADIRRRVCSNFNTTWQSDCHLHRHRCLCNEGLSTDCVDEHKHMHIDYYGVCQELPNCEKEVLEDFPRRMKDWLYTVMTTRIPNPEALHDANHHTASKWVDAVIWKFCDLDKHPHDRTVSRHELFPLRAPFLSMEPCISDFLNLCDSNNDHKVTLVEWGQCLQESEANLEDKCAEFKKLAAQASD